MTQLPPRSIDGPMVSADALVSRAALDAAAFAYLDMQGDSHERRIDHAVRAAVAVALKEAQR